MKLISKLTNEDGIGRLELAGKFFETGRYNAAEGLLVEALEIFNRTNGANHATTQAAKQNLAVVRNNRIQQLWMEVVAEEVLSIEEANSGGNSLYL
jgi:hypothetical protein